MGQIGINSCKAMSGACLVFFLSGCISISSSPEPRFYKLQSVQADQAGEKVNMTSHVLIGVGPFRIPEYQDRPQIVTLGKDKTLKFAQFDRWGESLDLGLARLIREDLAVILPTAEFASYPWNQSMPVKYQVVVEIVQLDSELDKELFMVAQWQVIDVQAMKSVIIKRSELHQPIIPQSYPGLVKALISACTSLSREIARALAKLEEPSQVPL